MGIIASSKLEAGRTNLFDCTRSAGAEALCEGKKKKWFRSAQEADIMVFLGWNMADKLRVRLRRQEALVGGMVVLFLAAATGVVVTYLYR
jgi:hypothetical protein